MNNLTLLLKIEFQKFISSFRSKKKISHTPLLYVALLIGLLIIAISSSYSLLIISTFTKYNLDPTPAVSLFAGLASFLIFMTTMSQARSIYIGDDHDMLASLPIRKRDIVASKIISLYLVELLFSIVVMVPHGIFMIILANNIRLFLISLLLAFTLPIIPIAISVLLSVIVAMLTARFKAANFVFVVLYAILIVAISMMSIIINNMKGEGAAGGVDSIANVIKWINPSYIFIELSLAGNDLFLLLFIGVNVITIILSILFLALSFDYLHDIVSSISMKKNYVRKDLKNKKESKVLLGLEFKRLIASKFYFVNTIMGSIMTIVGSTVFLISFMQATNSAEDPSALAVMKAMVIPIYIVTASLIIGMVDPTTCSINIEGKNFWLSKTLPLDYKKYMRAKLVFGWILTLPATLIAGVIATIFFHDNPVDIVFALVIPTLYSFFISFIGLIIAIKNPKLKWNSEAEAVKNSKSVVLGLLISLGIVLIFGTAIIVLSAIIPQYLFIIYIALTVLLLIGSLLAYLYLNKNFSKIINSIEEL